MQIRHRITLVFLLSVAALLGVALVAVYSLSAADRRNSYYERLTNRAKTTARLLIEVEEVDADLLLIIDRNTPGILPFERVAVYDYQDALIYHTEAGESLSLTAGQLDAIRLQKELRFTYEDFEALGLRYEHPEGRFVVVAMAKDVYGLQRLRDLSRILWVVFGSSLLLTAVLGWYYAGRVLRPISQVVEEVRGIGATNLDTRVHVSNPSDEIGQMAATFNAMLDRLEAAFTMQKQFIGNASHELRTPLTAIIGQLEVASLKPRTVEDYQRLYASLLEDMKRLRQLTDRLMLLAQAQSELPRHRFAPLRIDELIWRVREDVLRLFPAYQVTVAFDDVPEDEAALSLEGHEDLLYTALFNLLENGGKYAPDHHVKATLSFGEGGLVLRFTNRGEIPPEALPYLFEPFYRAPHTAHQPGHGLGLPLAHQIVRLHGGSLTVENGAGTAVTFRMQLPYRHVS